VATEADILKARRERAEALLSSGTALFPARVPRPLDSIPELCSSYAEATTEQLDGDPRVVRVAGRLVGVRSFGKAVFATLLADGERLQIWVKCGPRRESSA
jgi:lysyl-tRNA synthetase class 2